MHRIENLDNTGSNSVIINDPIHVLLEHGASIRNCSLAGSLSLGKLSCLSHVSIGKYFNLGSFSFLSHCQVGRYVSIGSRVSIGGLNHPIDWLSQCEFQFSDMTDCFGSSLPVSSRLDLPAKTANRVTIENDVWIGDNSVVLSGVTLPTGTIVGAGSVVTKSPENPYSIIVGNPARHLRLRFERNLITRLLNSMWWAKDLEELSGGLPFNDPSAVVDILNKRGNV